MRVRALLALPLAASLLADAPPASAQCAGFVDVSASDIACTAITWAKNRGITLGCGGNLFCPADPVNRMQMALFMNRLGNVLTPAAASAESSGTTLDISNPAYLCQTALVPAVNYARTFLGDAGVSFVANAPGTARIAIASSVDGGPYATFTGFFFVSFSAGQRVTVAGISQNATMPANSAYRYAIQVQDYLPGPVLTEWKCSLQTTLVNLNTN